MKDGIAIKKFDILFDKTKSAILELDGFDLDNDVMKKCLNPLYASMVSCAKRSKNLEIYLIQMYTYRISSSFH